MVAIADPVERHPRVLGLMPHPERFVSLHHHPNWTRQTYRKAPGGLEMFKNAVDYAR